MIAIVRIRGRVNVSEEITRTLNYLHLPARHSCTLVPDNEYYRGMLQKAKDYVTWGPISKEALETILPRMEKTDGKPISSQAILKEKPLKELNIKPRIRLHPPRGGFKSINHPYPEGDLGNRGEKINDLLVRMR